MILQYNLVSFDTGNEGEMVSLHKIMYLITHVLHIAWDTAIPSSMQDACHAWAQFNGLALHELSWLSGY